MLSIEDRVLHCFGYPCTLSHNFEAFVQNCQGDYCIIFVMSVSLSTSNNLAVCTQPVEKIKVWLQSGKYYGQLG